jgi:hypothetical protein
MGSATGSITGSITGSTAGGGTVFLLVVFLLGRITRVAITEQQWVYQLLHFVYIFINFIGLF